MLSGQNLTSPRESFLVTNDMIVIGEWKYVAGGTKMIEADWGGEHYPNASTVTDPISDHSFKCPQQGCLYNVAKDPYERDEVSAQYPDIVASMTAELGRQAKTIWSQSHKASPDCQKAALEIYGGFYGPFRRSNGQPQSWRNMLSLYRSFETCHTPGVCSTEYSSVALLA